MLSARAVNMGVASKGWENQFSDCISLRNEVVDLLRAEAPRDIFADAFPFIRRISLNPSFGRIAMKLWDCPSFPVPYKDILPYYLQVSAIRPCSREVNFRSNIMTVLFAYVTASRGDENVKCANLLKHYFPTTYRHSQGTACKLLLVWKISKGGKVKRQ